jgi:hypothetical protein
MLLRQLADFGLDRRQQISVVSAPPGPQGRRVALAAPEGWPFFRRRDIPTTLPPTDSHSGLIAGFSEASQSAKAYGQARRDLQGGHQDERTCLFSTLQLFP